MCFKTKVVADGMNEGVGKSSATNDRARGLVNLVKARAWLAGAVGVAIGLLTVAVIAIAAGAI